MKPRVKWLDKFIYKLRTEKETPDRADIKSKLSELLNSDEYSEELQILRKRNSDIIKCIIINEDNNSTLDDNAIIYDISSAKIKRVKKDIKFIKKCKELERHFVFVLKRHEEEETFPFAFDDSWVFLYRISPTSKKIATRWIYLVAESDFYSNRDETKHETIRWRIGMFAVFSELFFGSLWGDWNQEIRELLEATIVNSSNNKDAYINYEDAKLFFDLSEWLRDGRNRIKQEAWKGQLAVEHILQPDLKQEVGKYAWRAESRIGPPSAYIERFILAYGNGFKENPPELEDTSFNVSHINRPYLEGLINQWLWVVKAIEKNKNNDKWKAWLPEKIDFIQNLINKSLEELILPISTENNPSRVQISHFWSRKELLCRYLSKLGKNDMNKSNNTDRSFWSGLALVTLEILYEIKKQEHKDCDHPSLPCNGNTLTEALIRMTARFAHSESGVPWCIPIEKTLFDLYDSEGVFYMLKPRYRTHLYHVMDVCMLGDWFIKNFAPFKGIHPASWYIAALLHDVGYLAEAINYTGNTLEKMEGDVFSDMQEIIRKARKEAEKAVEKFAKFFDVLGLDKNVIDFEHGLASGLHVLEVLTQYNLSDDQNSLDAVKAIIQHNRSFPTVDVRKDSLTALLLLCDELQEWGRAGVEDRQLRRAIAASAVIGRSIPGWISSEREITIDLKGPYTIDITIDYGSQEKNLTSAHYIWIGKIHKLERIRWPYGIAVTLEIKTSSRRNEMSAFCDIVSANPELSVFRPMVEMINRKDEKYIKYGHDANAQDKSDNNLHEETLCLKLDQLGRRSHRLLPINGEKVKQALKLYTELRAARINTEKGQN
ncbi:hypothetical protein QUF90_20350 [Desulfococcaceae bacterium HSG9]|nr:hypothetical protein [Desulfococcaceae bacterium HSG9]